MFSSIHLKSRVENQKVLSASVLLFLISVISHFPLPIEFFQWHEILNEPKFKIWSNFHW